MIKHDLVEQVGGIERARGIVEGAPEEASHKDDVFGYVKLKWNANGYAVFDEWCSDDAPITKTYNTNWHENSIDMNIFKDSYIDLNDLRTAIAEHDNLQPCIGCGSPDLHKGGEIKEPKMCFKCYAAMTGFTLIGDQLLEDDELAEIKAGHRLNHIDDVTDMVTDIKNHLSPSTKVVDL